MDQQRAVTEEPEEELQIELTTEPLEDEPALNEPSEEPASNEPSDEHEVSLESAAEDKEVEPDSPVKADFSSDVPETIMYARFIEHNDNFGESYSYYIPVNYPDNVKELEALAEDLPTINTITERDRSDDWEVSYHLDLEKLVPEHVVNTLVEYGDGHTLNRKGRIYTIFSMFSYT